MYISKFKRHPTLFVPPGLSSSWRLRPSTVARVTLQTLFLFFLSTPYWAHYHSYNSPTASTACLQLTHNRLLSPPGPIKFGNLLSPPPGVPSLFLFSSSFFLSFLLQTFLCADRAVSQLCSVFFFFFRLPSFSFSPFLLFIALNTTTSPPPLKAPTPKK